MMTLVLLYLAAVLILVAEIFIPSHGILCIFGLGFLITAIVKTFAYGETAGAIAIISSAIALPTFAILAIKAWPHTRIGRLIAPPNPVYTDRDFGNSVEHLEPIVGHHGRAMSPLRPIGICEFDGNRYECVSESGLIDADTQVLAVGIRGNNLEVSVVTSKDIKNKRQA